MYSRRAQIANQVVALALIALFVMLLEVNVGLPPTIIVGASALVGFFCWRATNLRRAITPVPATVLFLLTTAALHVHMYEEHSALLAPALQPANPASIDAVIDGVQIEGMANHHLAVTGKYYFPGLYTAILPMIPGICAVWWMLRNRKASLREGEGEKVKMKLAA